MDIETFRDYCLSLPGTTEGMKWEHLCFMIEEKIFVLVSLDDEHLCLKCDPADFDALVARDSITQAPHFARGQWILLKGLGVMNDDELMRSVAASRQLVLAKLTKKLQQKYAE